MPRRRYHDAQVTFRINARLLKILNQQPEVQRYGLAETIRDCLDRTFSLTEQARFQLNQEREQLRLLEEEDDDRPFDDELVQCAICGQNGHIMAACPVG